MNTTAKHKTISELPKGTTVVEFNNKNSIAVIVHKWKEKEAVIDQAKYKKIMKDPKLKSIVRQLKEIDDEEEWWLLAESLRAFCSRKEIDLIDTVNGWNIND